MAAHVLRERFDVRLEAAKPARRRWILESTDESRVAQAIPPRCARMGIGRWHEHDLAERALLAAKQPKAPLRDSDAVSERIPHRLKGAHDFAVTLVAAGIDELRLPA